MNIICQHCQQDMPYTPLEEMEIHGIKVYFCKTCQFESIFWLDGARASTHLYTFINDKMYRWSTYPDKSVRLWHFKTPGTPGISPNKSGQMLIHFKNINSHVNPQTVGEKVRNILLFL